MSTNHLQLENIDEAALERLCVNSVPEGREIEFKRDTIGTSNDDKKEFLKDVSALANTAGGDLIIGIGEKDGVAAELVGILSSPHDQEIRRLESIISDGLEPRLVRVRTHHVPLTKGGYALVIRVPPSWNPPHRVIFGNWSRFFARGSRASFEMSVEQLRAAFLGSSDLERRINDRRLERLAQVQAGMGVRLAGPGHLVLHIAPVQPPAPLDTSAIIREDINFGPMRGAQHQPRPTLDGVFVAGYPKDSGMECYTRVFRDGWVESALGGVLDPNDNSQLRAFPWEFIISTCLVPAIKRHLAGLTSLGVRPPFVVMLSLLDVEGSHLAAGSQGWGFRRVAADRADMLIQPVLLEDVSFSAGWQRILLPMLDQLWNGYGAQRCSPYFDEKGDWIGPV